MRKASPAHLAVWLLAALLLCGCDRSLATQDLASPQADMRITKLAVPGGSTLAPVLSAGTTGNTTGMASAEFPVVGVEVTIFNGVSLQLTAFAVSYVGADGAPLDVEGLRGGLATFIPAAFNTDPVNTAAIPASTTVNLQVVSGQMRSFLAGPDGLLGTDDDLRSQPFAVISIGGRDINGHDVSSTTRLSITAKPEAANQAGPG